MKIKIAGLACLHIGMIFVFFGGAALDSPDIGIPMAICAIGIALLATGARMLKDE